jgi:hypothetical protein
VDPKRNSYFLEELHRTGTYGALPASAQEKKSNIIVLPSDDVGWGDLRPTLKRSRRRAGPERVVTEPCFVSRTAFSRKVEEYVYNKNHDSRVL